MRNLILFIMLSGLIISCEKNETVETLNGVDQLEQELKSVQNPNDTERCAELLYPVDYIMPDGTIVTIFNEGEVTNLRIWYQDNPGYEARPEMIFPVQMIFKGKNYTINNVSELNRIRSACNREEINDDVERVDEAQINAIRQHLLKNGIERDKVDLTIRVILRTIEEAKGQDRNYQISDRLKNYLTNVVGLTEEQLEVVRRLIIRLANS